MNIQQDRQLKSLVGKPETLKEARALLSLARAKTGPGSGHSLGVNVSGLPAICAFLASEKLGNGDVTERVAQQSACLAPRNFALALATVRNALGDQLSQKSSKKGTTYKSLCRDYSCAMIVEDAVYWMEEVEKLLVDESGDDLKKMLDTETRSAAIKCAVYRFTCINLQIPTPRQTLLSSDQGVSSRDLQYVAKVLEEKCTDIRDEIWKSQGAARSGRSSPMKLSPTKQASGSRTESSLKRRISNTPTLTMAKRLKASSPSKMDGNGEDTLATPSRPLTRSALTSASPTKRSAAPAPSSSTRQAKASSSSKLLDNEGSDDDNEVDDTPSRRVSTRISNRLSSATTPDGSPTKSVARGVEQMSLTKQQQNQSPSKAKGKAKEVDPAVDAPSPKKRGRPPKARAQRTPSPVPDVMQEEDAQDEQQDVNEDEDTPDIPLCHHRRPSYLDRRFFSAHYDLRVARNREACEKNFEELVAKFGFPFNI